MPTTTVRETALRALFGKLQQVAAAYGEGAVAERNPQDVVQIWPTLRQFDLGDQLDEQHDIEAAFGSDICIQPVEIQVWLQADTAEQLTAAVDALRGQLRRTIEADYTLGGTVDDLMLNGTPAELAEPASDRPAIGFALLYELHYTTAEGDPFARGS